MSSSTAGDPPRIGICSHCYRGLLAGKYYFDCMYCGLMICAACRPKHPNSHADGLRRTIDRMLSWNHAAEIPGTCSVCSQKRYGRAECSNSGCDVVICHLCWEENHEALIGHEHKGTNNFVVPGINVPAQIDADCTGCAMALSLAHCSSCYEGITEDETYHECHGCTAEWGQTYFYCDSCLPIGKSQHPPDHVFKSYRQREMTLDGEGDYYVQCLECSVNNKTDATALTKHPHTRYEFRMGPLERDRRSQREFRTCPRRSVKNIDVAEEDLYDGEMGCQCCFTKFLKDPVAYFCRKCGFTAGECCHDSGKFNHPHQMIRLFYRRTVPPEDTWKWSLTDEKTWCDGCKADMHPYINSRLQCDGCKNYDLCVDCLTKDEASLYHPTCSRIVKWNFLDPQPMGDAWYENQKRLLEEFIAEARAAAEAEQAEVERLAQEQRAAEQKAEAAAAAARRQRELAAQRTPAPVSRPATNVRPLPTRAPVRAAQPVPAARRKSSGFSSFMKGALQVTNAVLGAEQRMLAAQNGGGTTFNNTYIDSNSGGSGSMDMSSFWAPINQAAQSPIQ